MEISFIIPCLNEERTLPFVIEKAFSSLHRLSLDGEVIVADNGSSDASVEIAEKMGARVVHVASKGYGNALIGGMSAAHGRYLLMGDADDSYNFAEIDDFIVWIRQDFDLVIGTRLKGRIEKGAMPFLHRYLGTPVLTFLVNFLFGLKISDCNSGMRCLSKAAFDRMQLCSSGMEFASEMLIKAGLTRLRVKEIPITLYKDKRDKPPHLNTWRDGWRHLKFMFLYSPTYLFLAPGSFLMMIGLVIMLALQGGPIQIEHTVLSYHTAFLGSLLFILGFQTLNTGFQAKAYAQTQAFKFRDPLIEFFYRWFSLERGIFLGFILFFLGFLFDFWVLAEWVSAGYKNLDQAGRVVLASTLMIAGVQIIFSTFFFSILERRSSNELHKG